MNKQDFNIILKNDKGLMAVEITLHTEDYLTKHPVMTELGLINKLINNNANSFEQATDLADYVAKAVLADKDGLDITIEAVTEKDINMLDKTYIINQEKEGLSLGIYTEGNEIEDYKIYSVAEETKRNSIKRMADKEFKNTEMLNSGKVMLNGTLGVFVKNAVANSVKIPVYMGVSVFNKSAFEEDLDFYITRHLNEFKKAPKIVEGYPKSYEEAIERSERNVKELESGFEIRISDSATLYVPVDENGDYSQKDVFIKNTNTGENIAIRNKDEPSGEDLYMDSSLSGFCFYLSDFKELKSSEDMKYSAESLSSLNREELILLSKTNKESAKKMLSDIIPEDLESSVTLDSFGKTQIKVSINGDIDSYNSHKLYLSVNEGELTVNIAEGKISGNSITDFLIKSNTYKTMEKLIDFIEENKTDMVTFINNKDLTEEAINNLYIKNKEQKRSKPKI
jgi:hypothetical protein